MIQASVVAASVTLLLQAAAPTSRAQPPTSSTQPPASAAVTVQQLTYKQADGTSNQATLVTPAAARTARPAILYLHWYEPPRPTSNRTEFLAEAVDLAASGVVSLLVDTPWSGEKWFATRDAAHDYEFTLAMEKNLRGALDVLLAQPGIDKTRVAIVGHDFGAMWGALAAAHDPRVTQFVFMAGSPWFSKWYLFQPKRDGAEKEAFVARLAPLDPIAVLPGFAPRPVLLQFGTNDKFIPNEDARALADAVTGPKTFKTYDFEHELTWQARVDRVAWLKEQFRLR